MGEGAKENTALSQIGENVGGNNSFWTSLDKNKAPFSVNAVGDFFEKHRDRIAKALGPENVGEMDERKENLESIAGSLLEAMKDLMEIVEAKRYSFNQEFRDEQMERLYEHYAVIQKLAFFIAKKIEVRGFTYLMTDEGYNEEFVLDIEKLLDTMCFGNTVIHVGGNIDSPSNQISQINSEKELRYGDKSSKDPIGTDREWEAEKIDEISKSLANGQTNFEEISQKIERLATGIIYDQKTMANNDKTIIERTNTSNETGHRIHTDRERSIDYVNENPAAQLDILIRMATKGIRASVNSSLAKLQIVKFNELLRESERNGAGSDAGANFI